MSQFYSMDRTWHRRPPVPALWWRKDYFNWFPQTFHLWRATLKMWSKCVKWQKVIRVMALVFLFISVFFFAKGLRTWSGRNREEERLEERKSGRKRVIIEQSWSAAAGESNTGLRSHQECNGSEGKNMIFSPHRKGGSRNKWGEESTAKWEIVLVKDYRGRERTRETDTSDLEFM